MPNVTKIVNELMSFYRMVTPTPSTIEIEASTKFIRGGSYKNDNYAWFVPCFANDPIPGNKTADTKCDEFIEAYTNPIAGVERRNKREYFTNQSFLLLNMDDVNTIHYIYQQLNQTGKHFLQTVFPIKNGRMVRNSKEYEDKELVQQMFGIFAETNTNGWYHGSQYREAGNVATHHREVLLLRPRDYLVNASSASPSASPFALHDENLNIQPALQEEQEHEDEDLPERHHRKKHMRRTIDDDDDIGMSDRRRSLFGD